MGTHEMITKFDPQKYIKLIIAVAGAIASALMALGVSGGHLTAVEYVNVAIAVVGAFQVWYVTETADNPNGKAAISGVSAALVALASVLGAGGAFHVVDIAQILVAGLTATGILAARSTSLARKALPASYHNNTYVVDAGTLNAQSIVANPVTKAYMDGTAPTQVINLEETK